MAINGKCDVAAGFSPPFAEAADVAKRVQWKAEAFRYIICTNCVKQLRTVNCELLTVNLKLLRIFFYNAMTV